MTKLKVRPRLIGWLSSDAMTPAEAADAAISRASQYREPVVIHLDRVTGRMWLVPRDEPVPKHTFARGVAHHTDPDVLTEDLRSEALEARLIPGYQPRRAG